MHARTSRRVAHAVPRVWVFLMMLAVLVCMTGVSHAHDVGAPQAHEHSMPAHSAETQLLDGPGLDPEPGSPLKQGTHGMPMPMTGDSGHCSVGATSDSGCLTTSPGHLLAAPPPSSIGWLGEAPSPAHPPLRPTAYHPAAPTPGELSINRT